jgi:hypothetical protein
MRIKKIENKDFNIIINYLCRNFSSPTHWPEWNLLIRKYYNTNFYYFGLVDKFDLIGILPIHEVKSGNKKMLKSGQFHYIPNGGWLLKSERSMDLSDIPIPFNASIECFALPELKEFGVSYSKFNRLFSTLIIDLNKSEEEIWKNCVHSKRRNMIRKALKTGIIIQNDKNDLNNFYSLYSEANQQNGLDCLPYDYFNELVEIHNLNFKPLVAYYEEKPIATLGLIHDKNYAIYWIGATSRNSINLGQGELLQWEAIKIAKALGCIYYDLCYIEKDRFPYIYEFKKDFSTNEVKVPFITNKNLILKIINKIKKD